MTDEELNQLNKVSTENIDFVYGGYDYEKLILELITAEQNRRAVRSEDVQRAIEYQKCRKRIAEKNKENLQRYGNAHLEEDIAQYTKDISYYDLAIQALEQINTWSCTYCGEAVHQKEDIDYHIRNCSKHPIAQYRHRIAELEQALEAH